MSFYTGTGTELIYVSNHAAATLAFGSSGAEAQVNTGAAFGPQAHLPPDFWLPNPNQVGRGIKIVARGSWATGTLASSFTLSIRAGVAGSTAAVILLGNNFANSPALASATNVWELSGEVVVTAMGAAGANTSILGRGCLIAETFNAGPDSNYTGLFSGGATPGTATTLDTSITNYINVNVSCSAVNSANIFTLSQLLIFGMN